jgi:oligoendopeptidase F
MNLEEEKAEALEIQTGQIRSYQEELEERIRQKEKELDEVKRKIIVKERMNERKREEMMKPSI